MRHRTRHESRSEPEGFALISVLIALAILLALLVPFLASVLDESGFGVNVVDEEINDQGNRGIRDRLLHIAGLNHPSAETSSVSLRNAAR